jgi:hypothetical protein
VPPAPEAAPAEEKPKAKRTRKSTGPRRTAMTTLFPDEATIEVLVQENPKRPGSKAHTRFQGYFESSTVGEARAKGLRYDDLAYDVGHSFIKVNKD